MDKKAKELLLKVAEETKLQEKLAAQLSGEKVNPTEGRPVLHTALRKNEGDKVEVDGADVVGDVVEVRKRMAEFSEAVRSGKVVGHTGKKLVNIVAIGIGGSFLGPEFVYEALRYDATCRESSKGMTLRFLANVDPTHFVSSTDGLNVEETLFVIVSKTFSTAETMLNARTCRRHILDHYKVADD